MSPAIWLSTLNIVPKIKIHLLSVSRYCSITLVQDSFSSSAKMERKQENDVCVTHRYNPGSDCEKVRFREDKLTEIVLYAINIRCKLLDAKIRKIKQENHSAKSGEQILRTECQTLRRQIEGLNTMNHMQGSN